MKKLILLILLSLITYCPPSVADTTADALIKMLSESYGAEVKAEITDDKCEITFPATTIEEEVTENTNSEKTDEEPQALSKTITTDIPATMATCQKTEDFNNHTQYHISHTSPHKLIAQFYNTFKFAFIKDIDIKSFSEDIDIVPDLNFISARNLSIGNASYTQKDATTGLKSELGNLKEYKLQHTTTQNGNNIKYRVEMLLDTLNIVTPLFSTQVKSEQHVSELEYITPKNEQFDYSELTGNIQNLLSAKSRIAVNGLKISVDIFGVGGEFDIDINNATLRNDKEQFESSGNMVLKNIAFIGDIISKEKQPKTISLHYSLKNVPVETLVEISKMQKEQLEKLLAEQENEETQTEDIDNTADTSLPLVNSTDDAVYDAKMAEILDKAAETAEFITATKVDFANAAIDVELVARRTNGYLSGISKVKVTNLYNLFPQQKQCLHNPKADEIPECSSDMMFEGLKEYIDVSKDTSETVYTYSEKGVFKNGEKIGDPIELNFQKMHQEKLQKDKEREEQMRQMMAAQSHNLESE